MFTYDVGIIYVGPDPSAPQTGGTTDTTRVPAPGPSHAIEAVLAAMPQARRRLVRHVIVDHVA